MACDYINEIRLCGLSKTKRTIMYLQSNKASILLLKMLLKAKDKRKFEIKSKTQFNYNTRIMINFNWLCRYWKSIEFCGIYCFESILYNISLKLEIKTSRNPILRRKGRKIEENKRTMKKVSKWHKFRIFLINYCEHSSFHGVWHLTRFQQNHSIEM